MKWFLAGLGVGVTLGVLYAPEAVVERRRRLIGRLPRDWEAARERGSELIDRGTELVDKVRERGAEVAERVRETGTAAVQSVASAVPAGAVDPLLDFVNTATEDQLLAIKGIGPKTAQQILAGRPYESVDGMEGRASRAQVDAIREQLTNAPSM